MFLVLTPSLSHQSLTSICVAFISLCFSHLYHWPNCLFENVVEMFQVMLCQLPAHSVTFQHSLQLGLSSALCRLPLQSISASGATPTFIFWIRLSVAHKRGLRYKPCSTWAGLGFNLCYRDMFFRQVTGCFTRPSCFSFLLCLRKWFFPLLFVCNNLMSWYIYLLVRA